MERDRKPARTEPDITVLNRPMFVTDARGRTVYLNLTAMAVGQDLASEADDDADPDLDSEVVRWRI